MDKLECDQFVAGLKDVFSFLKSDSCNIPDDAILHLFVDTLRNTLTDVERINQCCLVEFLVNVADQTDSIDAGIVTVVLEIAGWLGSEQERFLRFLTPLSKCLRSVWTKSTTKDNSIMSSLFNCLSCLTKHEKGLKWLIEENKDLHKQWLFILETGSSIFLQKAVVNYVCRLCTAEDVEMFTDFLETIIKSDILPVVKNFSLALEDGRKPYKDTFITLILTLMEEICVSESVCNMMMTTDVMDELGNIVVLSNKATAQAAVNVLKVCAERRREKVAQSIDTLVKRLCMKGNILLAQNLVMLQLQSKEKTEEMFLIPIQYVLGEMNQEDLGKTVIPLASLHKQMATKHQITAVLCRTITNISTMNLIAPDVILRLLSVTVSGSDGLNPSVAQQLLHNARVQRSCLQYFSSLQDFSGDDNLVVQIVSTINQIMSPADIESQTYLACTKCLSTFLPRLLNYQKTSIDIPEKLAFILQQQLCSLNWEQRDTTLELLSIWISQTGEDAALIKWLEDNKLHYHIWQCKEDGESYVRATAITCLYDVSTCTPLWNSLLLNIGLSQSEVINMVGEILESDTEAFTRRSAAKFLHRFYIDRQGLLLNDMLQKIAKMMGGRLQDFDWEVKLQALDFIQEVFAKGISLSNSTCNSIPDYARSPQAPSQTLNDIEGVFVMFKKHFDTGCLQALFVALEDYDRKVSEKANIVIVKVKIELKSFLEKKCVSGAEFQDYANKVCTTCKGDGLTEGGENLPDKTIVDCLNDILGFDESKHVHKHGDESDYLRNPLSIIQDILSYGQKSVDDNVVDCY